MKNEPRPKPSSSNCAKTFNNNSKIKREPSESTMRWFRNLTRPIHRSIDRWLDIQHSFLSSLNAEESVFLAPFRWTRDAVVGTVEFVGSIFREFSFLLPIDFVSQWFSTRDYRALLTSLPAMAAIVALGIGTGVATLSKQPEGADYFVNRAIAAKQSGRDDEAALYLQKASLSVTGTRDARFQQALLLQSVDRLSDAYNIIVALAPDDEPGYIPAHLWRVQYMATQLAQLSQPASPPTATDSSREDSSSQSDSGSEPQASDAEPSTSPTATPDEPAPAGSTDDSSEADEARPVLSAEQLAAMQSELAEAIDNQLQLILRIDPNHLDANERIAIIAITRGQTDRAIEHLARIVDGRPDGRVLYAQLLEQQNRKTDARLQAELARTHHENKLKQTDLSDDIRWQHRMRLSYSLALLEKYETAMQTLLDEGQLPAFPAAREQLAGVLFRWSESITGQDAPSMLKRLQLLNQALRLMPRDPRILERIAVIAGEPGEPGTIASETLKDLMSTGQAPPVVRLVLAMNAARRGDLETSMLHYELAYQANPDTPITLNNLAYLLAHQAEPDLDRALSLINQAIELNPQIPDFYDTRGDILMQQKQWKPAINDLEKALAMMPSRPAIHRKLADSYEAAGDQELAAMHREQARRKEVTGNR